MALLERKLGAESCGFRTRSAEDPRSRAGEITHRKDCTSMATPGIRSLDTRRPKYQPGLQMSSFITSCSRVQCDFEGEFQRRRNRALCVTPIRNLTRPQVGKRIRSMYGQKLRKPRYDTSRAFPAWSRHQAWDPEDASSGGFGSSDWMAPSLAYNAALYSRGRRQDNIPLP
jgi:hypothetical protein